MAKKFGAGVVTGVLATVGALAAGLATYKKKVVAPEQKEADRIEQNRIKANKNNALTTFFWLESYLLQIENFTISNQQKKAVKKLP